MREIYSGCDLRLLDMAFCSFLYFGLAQVLCIPFFVCEIPVDFGEFHEIG